MKVDIRRISATLGVVILFLPLITNARWISVDPQASKYPSWSPYVYTLNNPMGYIDPDGQKVEFAPNQTQSFKNDFWAAIKYQDAHGNGGTFSQLQKYSETIYISAPTVGNTGIYDPSIKTIFWDPNQALEFTTGGSISPATILQHEGAHAEAHITDPKAFKARSNTPDANYGNAEEKRVIQQVEVPAAKKAGEDTRTDHKGTSVSVSGPTQRPTPPPPPPRWLSKANASGKKQP
ncbi:MAG: hypothetical protein NTV06_01575 [candidate division Zixibacteria bacterium]|nr:hypothetical protein [candidate division Zixibacteria bacterium]